jgi:hypothetical protein
MKVTLNQLVSSQQSLQNLVGMSLPISVSYKISKLINKSQPDLTIYEEKRVALVKEFGIEDPETKNTTVQPDKLEEFQAKIKELLEVETDINFADGKDFEKISIASLGNVQVTPADLVKLDWIFTE